MKKQYMIGENNKYKRKLFFNYIIKNFNLEIAYPYTKERFINSNFPFVVDFEENLFWICDSITCLALASQNNNIKTINEFKKEM